MSEKVDVQTLMEQIRNRVRADFETYKDRRPKFQPYAADHSGASQFKAGDLLASEELRYLNEQFAYAHQARIAMSNLSSHRKGLLGRCVILFKRKLFSFLSNSIFKEYFEREREYTAQLVRFLNTTAKYIDARDAHNFWEIIRKIDVDITRALERIERINDEQTGSIRSFERQLVDDLNSIRRELIAVRENILKHEGELKVLDSVTRGLEGIIARASAKPTLSPSSQNDTETFKHDERYLLLENRYRGSEKDIRERVSVYVPYFQGTKLPILEIGGGRGELQSLFKEASIPSYTVDTDGAMVETTKSKGLDARHEDALRHLASLPDKSLGGIIAVQVVEHLPMPVLEHLCKLASDKVVSGGKIIFETINPKSVLALSSNYFRDPTHIWPLHPDTLSYMMTLQGLKIKEIKELSPVPVEGGVEPIPSDEYLTPRWKILVESINRTFARLHALLYGHQDYCVIAEA